MAPREIAPLGKPRSAICGPGRIEPETRLGWLLLKDKKPARMPSTLDVRAARFRHTETEPQEHDIGGVRDTEERIEFVVTQHPVGTAGGWPLRLDSIDRSARKTLQYLAAQEQDEVARGSARRTMLAQG